MTVNTRAREVSRAQRAMRQAPDTRAIKMALEQGNHYVEALLRKRGVVYVNGMLVGERDAARGLRLAPAEQIARERAGGMDV